MRNRGDWRGPGRLALLVFFFCAVARGGLALDAEQRVTQYVRDSWFARDGAPAGTITAITQTRDGYLWLGTRSEGLVRFDGAAFVRDTGIEAAVGRRVDRVISLLCDRDGTLWVGTRYGLARLRDGRWAVLDRGELQNTFGLHQSSDGTVRYARPWEGLYRVDGDRVELQPLTGKPLHVSEDRDGVLWVGGYEGLWRIAGDERRLLTLADGLRDDKVNQVLGTSAGDLWVGFANGLSQWRAGRHVRTFTTADGLSSSRVTALAASGDGTLWVGTAGGLNRFRADRFESLTQALGLSNDQVTALHEDREGSLWIGTASGLNRLRNANVLTIGEPEGQGDQGAFSVAEGPDGAILVSRGFGGIQAIRQGTASPAFPASAARFDGPLYVDEDGGVWSGRTGGVTCRKGRIARDIPVPGQIQSIGHDGRSVVVANARGEVFRLVDGTARRFLLADGSPLGGRPLEFDYVWMMHRARDGTFWLATSRGAIAVREGVARQVWHQGTLSARSIHEDADGTLWFGSDVGILRYRDGVMTTFTSRQGLPLDGLFYVLPDQRGDLWMSSSGGLLHVRRRELEEVAAGRAATFPVRVFGPADGMRGLECSSTYQPVALAARDGRLWFATPQGAVVVDPARIQRNDLPPPVLVESLAADGKPLPLAGSVEVAAGTRQLVIHYTGLSLIRPELVRFRYMLEGFDHDWIDAGDRRVAYYTRLPPGRYRFRVIAANNDGVWNETGAGFALRQLPEFYETGWFAALCAVAVLGAGIGVHRVRLRAHLRREAQLAARVQEGLARIKTLSGMLPICAWCKKVREDTGYWRQIETYVAEHSHAEFTHGICPDCGEAMKARTGDTAARRSDA